MRPLAALFLLILSFQLVEAQWVLQPRVTTANIYQVRFIDRNNGWTVGEFFVRAGTVLSSAYKSSIMKTTNAGSTWSERVLNNCSLRGLAIVSRSVGWAIGSTSGRHGVIYKTNDGGEMWNVVDSSSTQAVYYSINFLDELHGWIGGWSDSTNFVLRTTDGGVNWQRTNQQSPDFNEIFFLDALNGWDVSETGKICKTTDGGTTWQSVFRAPDPYTPSADYGSPLRRIRFIDPMHGYAVGGISGGETKVWTSDGGVNWNVVNKTGGSSLHGLWFTDANNGWCVGGANAGLTIQKTSDGGKTWTKQQIPSGVYAGSYLEDIAFVSPSEGWIVADSGYILKTMTGGITPVYATAHRVSLNRSYARPAKDSVLIRTVLEDPTHNVASLSAIVVDTLGVVRDSVRLYNDGLHGDGSAGDSVWASRTLAPPDEGRFTVRVLATDTTFRIAMLIPDVQLFYTNGPIVYRGWTASTSDSIPYPGSVLRVRIRLANTGKLATVRNVIATMSALDTMTFIGTVVQLSYGDIASGQESTAPATQGLKIVSSCPPNTSVRLLVSISTEGFPAWVDTVSIVVRATVTEIGPASNVPTAFALRQNFPNPFNPSTTITFSTPVSSFVSLRVLDLLGREVATLVSDVLPAGTHARQWIAGTVPSGVYYYQLKAGAYSETKKLVLIK